MSRRISREEYSVLFSDQTFDRQPLDFENAAKILLLRGLRKMILSPEANRDCPFGCRH